MILLKLQHSWTKSARPATADRTLWRALAFFLISRETQGTFPSGGMGERGAWERGTGGLGSDYHLIYVKRKVEKKPRANAHTHTHNRNEKVKGTNETKKCVQRKKAVVIIPFLTITGILWASIVLKWLKVEWSPLLSFVCNFFKVN